MHCRLSVKHIVDNTTIAPLSSGRNGGNFESVAIGASKRARLETELSKQQIKSEISGSVWKIVVKVGDVVAEEDQIMILESMKMEIPVLAPDGGTISEIRIAEGDAVAEGQVVAVLE